MDSQNAMDIIIRFLPFFIPVLLVQLSLQVYSIINLVKRRKVRFNNKILWGIVILFFGMLGAVCYLLLRGEEE